MDYYKVLGVDESSNQDDIKKAYRKLSLKHHPDRGGDGEQFKKINEAYSVLGDPEKRRMYKMQNANPFSQMNGGVPGDMDPIFKMFFGGGFPGMTGAMNGMGGIPGMPHVQIFRNGQPINMQTLQKPTPIIKNVISTGINSTSQLNTIKKFVELNEIEKTVFLIPNSNYNLEIKQGIKNSKVKTQKKYFYDIEPTKLTKQVEKITNYEIRKQNFD